MKRRKYTTILSFIFMFLSVSGLTLTLFSGSIIFLIATLLFFVLSLTTRRKESFSEYRDRYEEKYLTTDEQQEDAGQGNRSGR
jgi:hypothetical protein